MIDPDMVDLIHERHELLYTSSSIAALPIEILSLVFHEVQRTRRATGKPMIPHVEITLSHVCSHWRAVMLSLPSMWCVFQHSYVSWYGPVRPTGERLTAYLERSGEHPFDLWIDFKTEESLYNRRLLPLLTIAIPHLHRFRVLHLLSDATHPLKEFVEQLASASAPLLETCAICPDYSHTSLTSLIANKADIFRSGVPSLKYLRMDETSMFGFLPPLDSVVHLRIETRRTVPSWIPNTAFDAILSLPNLETLSLAIELFELQAFPSRGSVPKEPIRANKLKHFRSAYVLITIYTLSHVVAPSLESITMNGVDLAGLDDRPSIPNHVAFPSLRIVAFIRAKGGSHGARHGPNLQKLMAGTRNVEELLFWGKTGIEKDTENTHCVLLGTDRAPSPWENIRKATLNIPFSSPTEILLYHQFIAAKPNLEVLRVPPRCLELPSFLQGVPPHIDLRAIDESEPPLPLCWVPGPDWLDTEEDPFLSYCQVFE
ncbi:hypothetical protein DFP72DRAFT_887790 [Ephemerocybe angulata]|uniref:F-box domain-containing protein n=1 Tax=Ephemerocybe angulata TaxID=980116 RepID=A0A8H6I4A7_9AGAR|nr:hypothetical protein DFP72DRAFT_887790 [Tulosesus angulatus]